MEAFRSVGARDRAHVAATECLELLACHNNATLRIEWIGSATRDRICEARSQVVCPIMHDPVRPRTQEYVLDRVGDRVDDRARKTIVLHQMYAATMKHERGLLVRLEPIADASGQQDTGGLASGARRNNGPARPQLVEVISNDLCWLIIASNTAEQYDADLLMWFTENLAQFGCKLRVNTPLQYELIVLDQDLSVG